MRSALVNFVTVVEAKRRFSALLRRVTEGEVIGITHRGKAVAWLMPVGVVETNARKAAIEKLKRFGKGRRLGKLSIRELIDAGRRF